MQFTRRTVVAALATTGVGISGLSHPFISRALAAEYDWKFGHGFPAGHPVHVFALEAAAKIKQDSGGRVEIGVFPNSQLGGDSDMLAQVRSGAIDFFSTGGLIFATLVPIASISGMGFAFRDVAQCERKAAQRAVIAAGSDLCPFVFGQVLLPSSKQQSS